MSATVNDTGVTLEYGSGTRRHAINVPALDAEVKEEVTEVTTSKELGNNAIISTLPADEVAEDDGRAPTEEEKQTLRRVSGPVPWASYVICLVELANMASYYGVAQVFSNFIQRPLPEGGNSAGAPPKETQETAGALGMGLETANALTTLFSFLAYVTPLPGGVIADVKLGRIKMIWIGTIVGFFAHILLVVSAIPSIITSGHAIVPFMLGMLILAFASGFIKPCISPIIADQSQIKTPRIKTLKSGEKVILDPNVTVENLLHLYYWAINLGDFFAIATSYAEKRIGFWLAYLTPGILYLIMPLGLLWVRKRLVTYPPDGSETLDAFKVTRTLVREGGVRGMIKGGDEFWNAAKPSHMDPSGSVSGREKSEPKTRTAITWTDDFVDDLRLTFRACKVFMFFPVWYLADGGLNTILNSLAGSMTTDGLPNDLLSNFNPISTVCTIPLYNYILYPTLRRMGVNFSPVRRLIAGYLFGVAVCVISALLQWRVYETSPCGYSATNCTLGTGVSNISVWTLVPVYWLQPMGGILISVTSYEMAYTLTPPNMKGVIVAIVFLTSAFSSAIVEICSPAFEDPYLIWPFVGVGAGNLAAALCNWYFFDDMKQGDRDLTIVRDRARADDGMYNEEKVGTDRGIK